MKDISIFFYSFLFSILFIYFLISISYANDCLIDEDESNLFIYLKNFNNCYPEESTNTYISNEKFRLFLEDQFDKPHKLYLGLGDKTSLLDYLKEVLGGPPNSAIYHDERYLVVSGCRHHSCPEKGMIWIDFKEKKTVASIVHFFYETKDYQESFMIFTNSYNSFNDLPDEFGQHLVEWAKRVRIYDDDHQLRFVGNNNKIVKPY